MVREKYSLFREDFFNVAEPLINSDILNQLKQNYAHDINSKRKLSNVKDLRTFIRLLEKRDIISYDNIEQLWNISKIFICKPDLENILLKYENWLYTTSSSPFDNMYQSDYTSVPVASHKQENISKNSVSISEPDSTCNSPRSYAQSSSTSFSYLTQKSYYFEEQEENEKTKSLQQAVLLQVSERLGRSWRDVARHLGIRECDIDAIQNKHPYNLKEQSYEILRNYILSNKVQWEIKLIRALEKGRRKDLKELVEELIHSAGNKE